MDPVFNPSFFVHWNIHVLLEGKGGQMAVKNIAKKIGVQILNTNEHI